MSIYCRHDVRGIVGNISEVKSNIATLICPYATKVAISTQVEKIFKQSKINIKRLDRPNNSRVTN